jgi:transposase
LSHTTFTAPDLTTFCRLDELGLTACGQRLLPERAEILCTVTEADPWCRNCGQPGTPRGTVVRRLAHEPVGWRPTTLVIRVRRYRCADCGTVWRQDTSQAAEPRAKISRGGLGWALAGIVCQHLSMARVAEGLGVSWNTANDAVLGQGQRVLINKPERFNGVKVIGVDEHVWRHTRSGGKYVTVIIDLTPVTEGAGPARLLDMVQGRSKAVFKSWLANRPQEWRDGIEVVAMDGFSGFKTAAAEELPDAVEVMDPFHVVRLAAEALDKCRQRVQQDTRGHRGRKGDPLYAARRTLLTGDGLLTEKQIERLDALFDDQQHEPVQFTWNIYQRIVDAYRQKEKSIGKWSMEQVIELIKAKIPTGLPELASLGRTLKRRAGDILAYFDRAGTSNGPTEAINGRLEHLRGSALGFRSLANYIARSLLESGGFRPVLHPGL